MNAFMIARIHAGEDSTIMILNGWSVCFGGAVARTCTRPPAAADDKYPVSLLYLATN